MLKEIDPPAPPAEGVWRPALLRAVEIAGSQEALAEAVHTRQSRISWLLNHCRTISAEMARDIADATGLPRKDFRPDLWD